MTDPCKINIVRSRQGDSEVSISIYSSRCPLLIVLDIMNQAAFQADGMVACEQSSMLTSALPIVGTSDQPR